MHTEISIMNYEMTVVISTLSSIIFGGVRVRVLDAKAAGVQILFNVTFVCFDSVWQPYKCCPSKAKMLQDN